MEPWQELFERLEKVHDTILKENKAHIDFIEEMIKEKLKIESENKALREWMESQLGYFSTHHFNMEEINNLLSKDKEPDLAKPEIVKKVFSDVNKNHPLPKDNTQERHELQDLVDTALIDDDGSSTKKKDWSDWYDYKGEVDFTDWIITKCRKENGDIVIGRRPFEGEEYCIKLDGVTIYEYDKKEGAFYLGGDHKMLGINIPIGHDPHNKIIIIKE